MASKVVKVVLYGSDFCPFCKKAVALLKKPYTYIDTTT
jgi:glutaredoxin